LLFHFKAVLELAEMTHEIEMLRDRVQKNRQNGIEMEGILIFKLNPYPLYYYISLEYPVTFPKPPFLSPYLQSQTTLAIPEAIQTLATWRCHLIDLSKPLKTLAPG